MPDSSPPRHREKLLDLHTEKTVPTNPTRLNVVACTAPLQELANTVHVQPLGESWEVESESCTLGQADTKREAEELATELGKEIGAGKVAVHTADGQVEKSIPLPHESEGAQFAE
jgi:hypothetical protein